MLRDFRRPVRALPIALLVALATASCGIKGPLTVPPKPAPAGADAPAPDTTPAPKDAPARDAPRPAL